MLLAVELPIDSKIGDIAILATELNMALPDISKVFIIDDDAGVRAAIQGLLKSEGLQSEGFESAEEFLKTERPDGPSCLILDVSLPGINGLEFQQQLRDAGLPVPIIFITGVRTEPADRVAGLLLGADDYVVKPFDPDELLARVSRFLRRSSHIHSQNNGRVAHNGRVASFELTHREQDVLVLMADGFGTDAIAQRLFISPKTVATHIQRILVKLGVHNRAQAVALAHREGLVESATNGAASQRADSPRQDAAR